MTDGWVPTIEGGAVPLPPSSERPAYRKVQHDGAAVTSRFMVVCDEGWRLSIVCEGMYEWAADWLISHVQGKPYYPLPAGDGGE